MNRALFITAGIVVIIFTFVVWLYLFLNGSPVNTNQVFSDLGIIEATERTLEPESSLDTNRGTTLNLADGTIQQITTEPVAGFSIASTSNGSLLRYIERGTGYIQEVNLGSGLKNQVTPHTTPGALTAVFSPNLETVVVTAEQNDLKKITVVKVPRNQGTDAEVSELPAGVTNITFIDDATIFYTRGNYRETVGYQHNIETKEVTEQFRLKLPDALVAIEDGEYYVYPRPAANLIGALYKVEQGELIPLGEPGLGLTAHVTKDATIVSSLDENKKTYQSKTVPNNTLLSSVTLPEKCTARSSDNRIWCGTPQGELKQDYLENWYKGVVISDDIIVEIDAVSGQTTVLSEPKLDTGRQVDAISMTHAPEAGRLVFINKIDATLWSLDL